MDVEKTTDGGRERTLSPAAQISRGIVNLVSEYTGRGPTRARTTIDQDRVSVLLEDTLTRGERTLVERGDLDTVMAMRASYQRAMGPEAIALVEGVLGRRVVAFMSANHADPDYAVEFFVLDASGSQSDGS